MKDSPCSCLLRGSRSWGRRMLDFLFLLMPRSFLVEPSILLPETLDSDVIRCPPPELPSSHLQGLSLAYSPTNELKSISVMSPNYWSQDPASAWVWGSRRKKIGQSYTSLFPQVSLGLFPTVPHRRCPYQGPQDNRCHEKLGTASILALC